MNSLPPWSFSMLDKFENCPRSAFHKYVLKEKEPSTPQIEEGNRVHKALEDRIKYGTPLPPEYQKYEKYAQSIANSQAKLYTELKLGINRQMQPTDFFGKDVWGRGALDIVAIRGETAWIGDYKTGKPREKELQVKIGAMMLFKAYPQVMRVTGSNIWLASAKVGTPYLFLRAQESAYWSDLLPRVQAMETALEKEYWPEKPSGLCGWCSVKSCKYNKS